MRVCLLGLVVAIGVPGLVWADAAPVPGGCNSDVLEVAEGCTTTYYDQIGRECEACGNIGNGDDDDSAAVEWAEHCAEEYASTVYEWECTAAGSDYELYCKPEGSESGCAQAAAAGTSSPGWFLCLAGLLLAALALRWRF